MERTWIPSSLRHPRKAMRGQFERLRDLMAGESAQTRDMLDIYRRSLEGKTTRDERRRANAQFGDLLRIAGLGAFFVVVPGSVVIIPIMVTAANKVGVRLLPDGFRNQTQRPQFTDGESYLQWWTQEEVARTSTITAVVGEATIEIDPGVCNPSPSVTASTDLLLEHMKDMDGKQVLDMGCGTGILGLHAGLAGAAEVVCADIDPVAINNADRNIEAHNLERVVRTVRSDLFGELGRERYNLIVANLPLVGASDTAIAFIDAAKDHLADDGTAVLAGARFGETDAVTDRLRTSGWTRTEPETRFGQQWWVELCRDQGSGQES